MQIPSSRQATDSEILLKLDDYTQPGLYDKEFRRLLERMVICSCSMIMLQRVYPQHRCDRAPFRPMKRQRLNEVYNSTGEEEGSDNEEEGSDNEEWGSNSEQMYEQ